jgi:hypothetical protein
MNDKCTPMLATVVGLILGSLLGSAGAAETAAYKPGVEVARPNLAGQVARPLRYRPEGEDFVIDNGAEFF